MKIKKLHKIKYYTITQIKFDDNQNIY